MVYLLNSHTVRQNHFYFHSENVSQSGGKSDKWITQFLWCTKDQGQNRVHKRVDQGNISVINITRIPNKVKTVVNSTSTGIACVHFYNFIN